MRRRWLGEGLYTTTITRSNFSSACVCRVCGRSLAIGDHVLARGWHAGFSCITCGWFCVDDVANEPAWKAALGVAGYPMTRAHEAWLVGAGIATVEPKTVRGTQGQVRVMRWTDVGKRLRSEARRAA